MTSDLEAARWVRPTWWPKHWMWHVLPEGDEYDVRLQSVINALMYVRAKYVGIPDHLEDLPVLCSDTDFNVLPEDHTKGVSEDDDITQVAIVRLALAAIAAADGRVP